jgi:hypothetical protein
MPELITTVETAGENRRWYTRVTTHPLFHPFFLLLLCFLAYGVLLPWLGFYADDWIMLWIYQKLGAWGVNYYHITNRPFLAPLYQVLLPLLGPDPWRWQLFAVLAPWLTSLSGWLLVKNLWPRRVRLAVFASILIAVFPGYLSHGVALTTGHRNIILTIFLLSLTFTVLSLRHPKRFWLFYLLALGLSIYNMLAMEYFLFMELMRPFVIWIVLSETDLTVNQKLRKTTLHFLPFFTAFCAVLYWRVFLFPYQTYNHSLSLFSALRENFLAGILLLIKQTALYFWMGMVRAWTQIFSVTWERINWGSLSSIVYLSVVLVTAGITFLVLRAYHLPKPPADQKNKTLAIQLMGLSVVPWLLGGIPFIVVGLAAGVGGYETRYLLPFLLVSCLWVAFLIEVLLKRYWIQILVLSAVVGLSAGLQFISSNELRAVDVRRNNFFWNLTYRIPSLEPGTMILTNDMPTGDGAAAWTYIFNWLYTPDLTSNNFPYLIMLASQFEDYQSRGGDDMGLIAAHFKPDFSKTIFLNYNGKNCPQVYNPEFPAEFPTLDSRAENWLPFASLKPILPGNAENPIDPSDIHLGAGPERGWCYYYEKADFARQTQDWQSVRELGDKAIFRQGFITSLDTELMPFILGYAMGGEWQKATELMNRAVELRIARDDTPNFKLMESTWEFIEINTPESAGKSEFRNMISRLTGYP